MADPRYLTFQPDALSNDVKAEVVTPHIAWAKPYAGGALKTLFIGPRFGHRETVEVMQRLSVQAEVVLAGLVNQWDWGYPVYVPGSTKADLLKDLDRKLDARCDLIVIGNLDWGLLPPSAVLKIFRQVSEGAGLVFVQYGDKRLPNEVRQLLSPVHDAPDFLAAVPLRQFQVLRDADGRVILDAAPIAECFSFRKGRACVVSYPGAPNRGFHYLTPDPNDGLAYEYAQAFLIKTLLWASGKASKDFRVERIAAPAWVAASDSGSIDVKTRAARASLACALVIRDRLGKIWNETSASSAETMRFPIPDLPAETYFADVTFRDGNNIMDWASAGFRVLSAETIQDIAPFREVVYPDEKLKCRILTSRLLRDGEELRVTLTDGCGRTYAQFKAPDARFKDVFPVRSPLYMGFEWPVADSLSVVNRVRVEWRANGRVLAFAEREFYVPRRKDHDFHTGVWSATERLDRWGWLATQLWSHESALGIDAALVGHVYMNPSKGAQNALALARTGVSPFPYIDRISYYGTSRERVPCLSDPVWIAERGAELRSWAWGLRKAGCIGYNLGDESNLSILGVDVCTAPATLKVFREWLAKQYGAIDALNAEHGSTCKSFEEVVPLTRKEAEAKGNLASWIDHKVFMASAMADYIGAMQGALRASDPLARAGCEGIWGTAPAHGFEWTSQAEKAGVIIPYTDEALAVEAVRSFVPPTTLTGIWTGGYPHIAMFEWKSRYFPWYALLHGMNSAWFYADYDGTTENHPMVMLSHDFTLNRAGRWFLEEAALIKGGIGKLILNAKRRNDPIALLYSQASGFIAGNHADDWIAALADAGYQYDVIARRDLEAENGLAKYKALALPHTVSLSEAEQKQIRQFVVNGGTVLADGLPGEYDGHGRKLAQNPVKDVFESKGGRAILLAFNLERYTQARERGKNRDLPAKLGSLLEQAGLPKRNAAPGMERIVYDIPGGQISAFLLRDTEQTEPTFVIPSPFESGKQVFDLIQGKAIDAAQKLTLKPGRPAIFASLDQKPGALSAAVEKSGKENRFKITVTQASCPFTVLHVSVSDPSGNPANGYTENCVMKDGRLEITRYLGEGAAPGAWTATLRDVLTGQQTTAKLEVSN
ncbi:MAG: beta-galactosidase [Verrucomicrobia bacterium]|nr:beta-galactosidase [Verrucomicrobiota bacterium]